MATSSTAKVRRESFMLGGCKRQCDAGKVSFADERGREETTEGLFINLQIDKSETGRRSLLWQPTSSLTSLLLCFLSLFASVSVRFCLCSLLSLSVSAPARFCLCPFLLLSISASARFCPCSFLFLPEIAPSVPLKSALSDIKRAPGVLVVSKDPHAALSQRFFLYSTVVPCCIT